ncbi:hypothetical protein ACO2Q3_16765 [Caulobacter sp. KR2-114]|uniref:hypothetical protein n=1 Tax=Caulobacter sp. KR2-114 TaxID=3400912 RepID=UPI003C0FBCB7
MRRLATLGGAALAAGLALAPTAALARADYWFLGAGQSTFDFVDVSRIAEADDGARLAWTTRVLEGKGTGKHKIKTVLTWAAFYCGEDRFQALKTVQYRGDGQLKSNLDLPGPVAQVIPGTVGASEYAFVCADPADRADLARDLGDIDPIRTADQLYLAPRRRR